MIKTRDNPGQRGHGLVGRMPLRIIGSDGYGARCAGRGDDPSISLKLAIVASRVTTASRKRRKSARLAAATRWESMYTSPKTSLNKFYSV